MTDIAVVTGSAGLVGASCVRLLTAKKFVVVGIDNDMRSYFFGKEASTAWSVRELQDELPSYRHHSVDIRKLSDLRKIFSDYGSDIRLIVHAAAQPSHDWAAKEPHTDFEVNANGTLNLLELYRERCPQASFVYCSTNKVYGDTPNNLPLEERETRWEIAQGHEYFAHGIPESMSVDQTKHSIFGVSKLAADAMVQEYGRYFGLKTGIFRGGCLTGPGHSGAPLHGFLAYLMKCAVTGEPYTIHGYKGKQVRDNIHSDDLANAFYHFHLKPGSGEVFNIGGGRHSNCSMLEAIALCEEITGKKMRVSYSEQNRIGDHIWWISDIRKFRNHYPNWSFRYGLRDILVQIYEGLRSRTAGPSRLAAAS